MKGKRLRLVYNPNAGRRKLTGQLDTVIRIFQESGHEVCVHRAGSPQDIEQIAIQSTDVDQIVIAGGDGSIHLAVNGLMNISPEQRPALGILPVGTANDLAYALHLPKSIPEACKVIATGKAFEIDTGIVNDRYFVNVASAGLLTDVSQKVDTRVKNTLGQLAYFLKGLETLPSFRPFRVEFEHDGKRYIEEVVLFMVANGLSVGGIRKLVPRASLTDGKLDILMVPSAGWPETVRLLLNVWRGEKADDEKVKKFLSSELIVSTDRPIFSDLDGEHGPESAWHIKIGPKITVLC
ncbi:diacylglycerol kinase family protein [Desulfosporosinus sp. BG]|uniref:diacylglycerol/lipid kinase family protein n=1 Tax=Desulfosporosinus sp. BG TaxID=1633135 RepID=UPI000839F52A|nr:diacylglycerol kinase family protein [Desulfosporosinus sp. BG]ODA42387.1 Transcription regulator (contains diacylglycerol kinase catalytic domain) [Desulfosporosinus sp. BG]